jgi:hypothetical protein
MIDAPYEKWPEEKAIISRERFNQRKNRKIRDVKEREERLKNASLRA